MPDRAALLPGEEWINSQGFSYCAEFGDSGKTLVPCLVLQQLMGISPKPGVASLPRRLEVVLLFLGPNLELANMQVLLQIGSVAWEQCLVLWAMLL